MKPTLLHRLRARLGVSRHKKKQGVAILTVLAIITLMTVLVVSFFNMAQTAKITAKGSVEIQRVTTLKDTIINLVIAQFREASRLSPKSASNPRDIVTWTSQPGAIRTFSGNPTDFANNRLFKLYSSSVPQLDNLRPYETAALLDRINEDNTPDWAERPDEFTDLNRPVYTAATGDRARATGATDADGYTYPIVDPRSYSGNDGAADLDKNTEGFTYSDKSLKTIIKGVDARKGQLAMPVRWIYLLQDGTLGYLDESKEFTSLNGSNGGTVSRENPIVGRMAWWADDESCKINVNTASLPAAWDTPRTTSLEDQWLGRNQPLAGEYQRYPGHPATVDLSAVFYPNRRWVPPDLESILVAGRNPFGGKMRRLDYADAKRIWDLAPFIVCDGEVRRGSPGTSGGMLPTPVREYSVGNSDDDRLFTSMDEVYFKATGSANKSTNSPRSNLLSENKDNKQDFLKTLQRSQFFLTHKSHSPELTNQGFPRVSMFPMDVRAVNYLTAGATGSLPAEVSPYDVTMALNSTIGSKSTIPGGNAYFIQRQAANSRHQEMFYTDNRQRNFNVFRYLKELSKLPIPGYPETVGVRVPALAGEDNSGISLAAKYPPGLNGTGRAVYGSVNGSSTVMDSSDRTQILLNMLDYTRSINMQPAFLTGTNKYDDGWGQAAGICGCMNAISTDAGTPHNACLLYTNQSSRSPKGAGRLYGPAEIAVVVNVAAKRTAGTSGSAGVTSGPWGTLYDTMSAASKTRADKSDPGTRYIVEVGFFMSGFNPKQGWSPIFPSGGLGVSSVSTTSSNIFAPTDSFLPIIITGPDEERLSVYTDGQRGANATNPRTLGRARGPGTTGGVLPLGGMGGPRVGFSNQANLGNSFATTRPFCVIDSSGGDTLNLNMREDPNIPLRVITLDGPNESDGLQAIDLRLPGNFFSGMRPTFTGESLRQLVAAFSTGAKVFPEPKLAIRSFVLPHGDYRLSVIPSRVDADVFVPHANYAQSPQAFSFYEQNSNPSFRSMKGLQGNDTSVYSTTIGLMNPDKIKPRYPLPTLGASTNVATLPYLPFPAPTPAFITPVPAMSGNTFPVMDPKILAQASMEPTRQATFAHARRDGRGVVPYRGSSDPFETGDFDTGEGSTPDGPYMNYPDEGDRRQQMSNAYFKSLLYTGQKPTAEGVGGQNISPNFLVRSPVDFGSIPTGVNNRVPWQTLRFRPDTGMNNPTLRMVNLTDSPPPGMPFANFCGPRDHFFLDMFWMPVVEPWSISEPFSTKGTINLNQQIFPFMYIERTTALHALMRGERMYAIPNSAAENYKNINATTGDPAGSQDATYRSFINAKETIRQFTNRYLNGRDSEPMPPGGNAIAFNLFRSASEICEMWLVPEELTSSSNERTLDKVIGVRNPDGTMDGFWNDHKLTGDNLRERPYANLYPRVTVRSNVFKLHLVAQTLQKALSTNPKQFDSLSDSVTAEWRGSCMIERSIDPRDPLLNNIDYTNLNAASPNAKTTPKLDVFYTYRVTEVKQLTQ